MRTKAAAARLPLSPSQPPSTSALRRPDVATTQRVARASDIPSRSEDDSRQTNWEDDSGTSGDTDDGTDVCGPKWCRLECSVVEHTCVQCNRGGKGLLVCSEISCPIAFHEECFGIKPQVDAAGKFYCPYCWYRRGLCRTEELREKVLKAKKGFMDFIGSKMPDDGRGMRNGVGLAEPFRERIDGGCSSEMNSDGRVRVEGVKVDDHRKDDRNGVEEERATRLPDSVDGGEDVYLGEEEGMPTVEAIEDSPREEEVEEEEDISDLSDSEESENLEEQHDGVADGLDEGRVGDREHVAPLKAEPLNVYPMLVHEKIHQNASNVGNQWDTTENTADASRDNAFLPEVPEISGLDAVTPVRPKRIKRLPYNHEAQTKSCIPSVKSCPQPSMTSGKEVKNLMKEVTPSKICGQPPASCKKWTSLTIFANDKRKRLHWTPEEEEMLEEGVTKFSSTANKNLPWRKILKFGHHIFDPTRTPSDLKDKWRSMGKKT